LECGDDLEPFMRLYDIPTDKSVSERQNMFFNAVEQDRKKLLEFPELFVIAMLKIEKATSLLDFLTSRCSTLTDEDCDSIMFQIFYALLKMQELGVMHNDLHFKNIMVEELPETTIDTYDVDGKNYKVPVKYRVYIFDWDMAYCDELGVNLSLNNYLSPELGICNKFTPKVDLYTVLRIIEMFDCPTTLKNMVREIPGLDNLHKFETYCCRINANKDLSLFIEIVPEITEMIMRLKSTVKWTA